MPDIDLSRCPYPGLRPFRPEESALFFGRDEQIEELIARLEEHRFVAVVGTSGCGKSSLIYAGLLPAIHEGYLSEPGTDWRVAQMRPGNAPISRLAESIAQAGLGPQSENTAAFVEATLNRGPLGLVEAVQESHLPAGTNLLLVVDQFEELFRYRSQSQTTDDADAFVNLLLSATRLEPVGERVAIETPIYVVLTMRSDFIGDCTLFPKLPKAINDSQFLTPRLTRDQYRAAIAEPANAFGGRLESALINRLLNDLRDEPSQLTLLQHALMQMWTEAASNPPWDGTLTLEHFVEIGGFTDALSNHCEEIYEELIREDPANAVAIEVLFRSLCERSSKARDIRRPIAMREIALVAGIDTDRIKKIVEAFRGPTRSFLMPPRPIELQDNTVIDISHEAIIIHWRRLNEWVEQEARSAETYKRLEGAAQRYGEGAGELWRGIDRKSASQWLGRTPRPNAKWAKRYGGDFEKAQYFLSKSRNVEVAKRSFLVILIVGFLGFSWIMRGEAVKQEHIAQVRLSEILLSRSREQSDKDLESLLAIEAAKANDSFATRNSLRKLASTATTRSYQIDRKLRVSSPRTVALGPDGSVAIVNDNNNIYFYHVLENEPRLLSLPESTTLATIISVAITDDGRMIAAGDDQGFVWLWRSDDSESPQGYKIAQEGIEEDDREVSSLAFSSNGEELAIALDDGGIQLWRVDSLGQDPQSVISKSSPNDEVEVFAAVEFSRSGRMLAGSTLRGQLLVWDPIERENPKSMSYDYPSKSIKKIAIHPSQPVIATGMTDGEELKVQLWKWPNPPFTFDVSQNPVLDLEFTDGGKSLTVGTKKGLKSFDGIGLGLESSPLSEKICESVGRNLTLEETKKYLNPNIYALDHKTCDSMDLHESFYQKATDLTNESLVEAKKFIDHLNELEGKKIVINSELEALYRKGIYHASQEDVKKAEVAFTEAQTKGYKLSSLSRLTAYLEAGKAKARQGDLAKAEEYIEEAKSLGWDGSPEFTRNLASERIVQLLAQTKLMGAVYRMAILEIVNILRMANPGSGIDNDVDWLDIDSDHIKEIDEKTKNVYGSLLRKEGYEKAITLLRNARHLDIAWSYHERNFLRLVSPLVRGGKFMIAGEFVRETDYKLLSDRETVRLSDGLRKQASKYAAEKDLEMTIKALELAEFVAPDVRGTETELEADALIMIADAYARDEDMDRTINAFERAKAAGADLDGEPRVLAEQAVAKYLIRKATRQAQNRNVDEAIVLLNRARGLGADIEREERQAWKIAADAYARDEDMDMTINAFERAKAAGADLYGEPEEVAKQAIANHLMKKASVRAQRKRVDEAIDLFGQANAYGVEIEVDAIHWNNLCWHGALSDQFERDEIMQACKEAQATSDVSWRVRYGDSYAVLLARRGQNLDEAARMFKAYYEWALDSELVNEETAIKRRKWAKRIAQGQHPVITDNELAALKH